MSISTIICHLIQHSKCLESKACSYPSFRLKCASSCTGWWGRWVKLCFWLRAAGGSGLLCFPTGRRMLTLDNAQRFVVRWGVRHAEVLLNVLADAQLDCLCWWNFPQLYLFVQSRMYVNFAALILCGWSCFLCFFWVLRYFLSVNCHNFNVSFFHVSVRVFFSS